MTDLAWILLAAAGTLAALDWVAVAARNKTLEYACKPGALVALVAVAIALHPHSDARRAAFVVALVLSLAGDVFLMLPDERRSSGARGVRGAQRPRSKDRFVAGLGAFFGAHVAYIVGLRIGERALGPLLVGGVLVFVAAFAVGRPILAAVRKNHPELGAPVSAYIAVISVMVACALATGEPFAATGAVVFMVSDSLIAWNRFVKHLPWAPVAIMVTYHLGQAGLVLSLGL